MSNRVTENDLHRLVDRINELTGNERTPYSSDKSGKLTANIGNYHLYFAYGGVNLHRISNKGGGVSEPLGGGINTKRELYNKMQSYIAGICQGSSDERGGY